MPLRHADTACRRPLRLRQRKQRAHPRPRPRTQKARRTCVSIVEPTFSEYALACRLAGLESSPLWGGIGSGADGQPSGDLLAGLAETPSGSAVFLANPCNPSGLFRTPDECLSLLAARPDLLWIIDEAFIEYAGPEADVSILRRMPPTA